MKCTETLLYVLSLFTHLFDKHLEFHRGSRRLDMDGFRGHRVGFPIHLLDQEIEAPADRPLLGQYPS